MTRNLARRVRTLEAAHGGAGVAWSSHEREALAAALASLGRTGELEDRWARYRAPRTAFSTENWAEGDEALRGLFMRLICERIGITLLPGDEDEVR
jgi:hypothetical protein